MDLCNPQLFPNCGSHQQHPHEFMDGIGRVGQPLVTFPPATSSHFSDADQWHVTLALAKGNGWPNSAPEKQFCTWDRLWLHEINELKSSKMCPPWMFQALSKFFQGLICFSAPRSSRTVFESQHFIKLDMDCSLEALPSPWRNLFSLVGARLGEATP